MIRRVRLIVLIRGLLAVAAVLAGSVLAIMGVDAAVVLAYPAARWAFSLGGLGLTLATAWTLLLRPLAQPLTLTRMARVLETRHPDLQERVSSAIELAALGGAEAERASAELVRLLAQDAASDLAGVRAKREFTARTVKPFLVSAACVLTVLATLYAIWPKEVGLLFRRAVAPHLELDNLQAAALKITPGDIMLLAGSPVRLTVEAPERRGLRAEVRFLREGRPESVERMKRLSPPGVEPVVFELLLPSVEESFEYRVRYGSGVTRPYALLVVQAPKVTETRVAYSYPAYTGLQPTQQVGEAQAIAAVAGTRVRIEAAFDRPCAAALRLNALTLPAALATNAVWLQTLSTNRTGRWAVTARDRNGFTNVPAWAAYTALPDRPPEVRLETPEPSRLSLPPYERLVCAGEARDDFGFGAMSLVVVTEKGAETAWPLTATSNGAARVRLEGEPDLQALFKQNVRRFRLFLRVADNLPPELGGPQVRESRALVVTLDSGARTLREQVREAARKELEELLRKAGRELQEAANRVSEQKGSFDKPELSQKAAQQLEAARTAAVQAEELLAQAAQATAKTPFAALAAPILDVRDEKVEPALQKVEKIPLTAAPSRRQAGDEAEQSLREAAGKVNELIQKELQEENRKQEEQSRLSELAQREAVLAEQGKEEPLSKQAMNEWAARQNEAEQKLWQNKPQLTEEAFNQVMENVRKARETMQQAERALTPERDQALRREENVAQVSEQAANLAEQAADKALEAAKKAEDLSEQRAATDALQKAAEKTQAAARKAGDAAHQSESAAQARQANEQRQAVEERQAIAERLAQAAREAQQAAAQAAQSSEQAVSDEKQAAAQAAQAQEQAAHAQAEAVEGARQAAEQPGMEKAEEAGRLASESAAFTQRAADLAKEAAQKSEAAARLPQEQQAAALKMAKGLSEQAKQVAAEATQKSEKAAQLAQEQLAQLRQAAKQAEARQASSAAVRQQAQEAVQTARDAAGQAQEAVQAAQQAVAEAREAGPLSQALAEKMSEAAALAGQAGDLAEQSGERTQAAEQAELGEAQEQAATQQALEEAQAAAKLAREAAGLATQAAQQAAQEMGELKQETTEAAQTAAQQAQQASRMADQAAKLAKALDAPDLQQAASQSAESADLAREAAALAQSAVQTLQTATEAADAQALSEARDGQAKAQQAQALARLAARAAARQNAEVAPLQRQAAALAQQAADAMSAEVEQRRQSAEASWAQAQARLARVSRRGAGRAGGMGEDSPRSESASANWMRFRGEMDAEACEELLKKTPAEYRELVKQYFEELSRDGQAERRE